MAETRAKEDRSSIAAARPYHIAYIVDSYFSVSNLLFMENYHLSIHMAFWKESMINWLSNIINRNGSAAKISQVLCSTVYLPALAAGISPRFLSN